MPFPCTLAFHTQLTLSSVSHWALYANEAIVAAIRMYAAYLSVVRMSMTRPLGYGDTLEHGPLGMRDGAGLQGAPTGVVGDGDSGASAHDMPYPKRL